MTEQELRTLVREAIARAGAGAPSGFVDASLDAGRNVIGQPALMRQHASHGLFTVPTGADADGPCVIEPAVACNHCGYCKSYGH